MNQMDKALTELVKISKAVGKDKSLVLGTSGNTSVKTDDGYMYIKANGTALRDMAGKKGWRKVKLKSVLRICENKSLAKLSDNERKSRVSKALLAGCEDKTGINFKPSIESCFHACLDRIVIHLHPRTVLSYACAKNGKEALKTLFKTEKLPPLWIAYADPCYALAVKMLKLVGDYKKKYAKNPSIIFLQNHGLVVTADSSQAAMRLVRRVVNICAGKLQKPKKVKIKKADDGKIAQAILAIEDCFYVTVGQSVEVSYFFDEEIAGFLAQKETPKLCQAAAVTPDELVEAHGAAVWLTKCGERQVTKELKQRIRRDGLLPTAFLIKPLGLFVVADKKRAEFLKDVITAYLFIRFSANSLSAINPITQNQRALIIRFGTK
jgi:rhamnose utilization protein RhaD (predicted bifunctional aldolase and dehydrogenase)